MLHFFVVLAFLRTHEEDLLRIGEDTLPETLCRLTFTGKIEVSGLPAPFLGEHSWCKQATPARRHSVRPIGRGPHRMLGCSDVSSEL